MVTREEWATSLLKWMGWPHTERNIIALVAWQAAEGGPENPRGQARWNPLNTIQPMPGATYFNYPPGVKNYATENDGLIATQKTFGTPGPWGYEAIIKGFRKSKRPRKTLTAVEASSWGTGGLAKSIVDDVKRHRSAYSDKPIGQ